ncbi:protein THEM6-like [Vanessa atalanta]|uniref:protein THEM6-like n=1 Tax=Vanessa atalanta TaxID=42275 RepID=UPI001FCCCB97|nr:protein THEM6-like [Vanessa atalanta]
MVCICILVIVVILCMFCDISYVIRTCFTVISGRLYQRKYSLSDVTVIYGLCTFQDCDIFFKGIRLARLVREIDFARYHFYDRTGIYLRSKQLGIKSLQGSTLTVYVDSVPLFVPYKITTKFVYWDERSLFFEHEVVTLFDRKIRHLLVSRQYAIGKDKQTTASLLKDLQGLKLKPKCPQYIQDWLKSMEISSAKLRNA